MGVRRDQLPAEPPGALSRAPDRLQAGPGLGAEHAAEFGGDPARVAVTGGSAGGHLAALVALTANDPAFQPGFETVDTSVVAACRCTARTCWASCSRDGLGSTVRGVDGPRRGWGRCAHRPGGVRRGVAVRRDPSGRAAVPGVPRDGRQPGVGRPGARLRAGAARRRPARDGGSTSSCPAPRMPSTWCARFAPPRRWMASSGSSCRRWGMPRGNDPRPVAQRPVRRPRGVRRHRDAASPTSTAS